MDSLMNKINYKILFLSITFAIIFSSLIKNQRVETDNSSFGVMGEEYKYLPNDNIKDTYYNKMYLSKIHCPLQNSPHKTEKSQLYFPGLLPGINSRKTLPSMRYTNSLQNPNMKLVKFIQDNAR